MKNVIIYYFRKKRKEERVFNFLKCQIDINLVLEWKPKDIILLSNIDIQYKNVKSIPFDCEEVLWSKYIYKIIGLIYLIKDLKINDLIWFHDWDAVQLDKFSYKLPENKDIAVYYGYYFKRRQQPNNGVMFIKPSGLDLLEKCLRTQLNSKIDGTERPMREVFEKNKNRIHELETEHNMGNTGFIKRLKQTKDNIKTVHYKVTKVKYSNRFIPVIQKQALTNKNTAAVLKILMNFIKSINQLDKLNILLNTSKKGIK